LHGKTSEIEQRLTVQITIILIVLTVS